MSTLFPLIFLFLNITNAFRLSPDDVTFPGIYTHDKITQKGVYAVVQKFIAKYQLIEDTDGTPEAVINRYFGTG